MKHSIPVTSILIILFIISQVVGLGLLANSIEVLETDEGTTVDFGETALGERPEAEGAEAFITLLIGGALATGALLLLARFKQYNLWKLWYFLAVFTAITVALETITPLIIALAAGLILGLLKIFKSNVYIHNASEVLVYSGISILLIPLFDIFWATMLLIAISLYDAYAVWKSKHMITLAEFQGETNQFAGLRIGYKPEKTKKKPKTSKKKDFDTPPQPDEKKNAILGGGDIAFPMIFIGSVLHWLILSGFGVVSGYFLSLIIVATAAISLTLLFYFAKEDTFYPAMPFLSAGCFTGFAIVAIIAIL